MGNIKTKSLERIEIAMQGMEENSLRYQILKSAKNFKTSWLELGRALYSVWKDKLYKEWGYQSFDIYTTAEIGIKKQTAMKLLRSYYFLEKEEPWYLQINHAASAQAANLPTYESLDLLRLAKSKKVLDEADYNNLKKDIFEKGKDAFQLRRDLTALIRQKEELQPDEVREKKRLATLRRLLATLKSLKEEMEIAKILPAALLKETSSLINKLEAQL
jgi:hypothetical protein